MMDSGHHIRVADTSFEEGCIGYSLQGLVMSLLGDHVFLTNSISSVMDGLRSSNLDRTCNVW